MTATAGKTDSDIRYQTIEQLSAEDCQQLLHRMAGFCPKKFDEAVGFYLVHMNRWSIEGADLLIGMLHEIGPGR